MAALVDFTVLTPDAGFHDGFAMSGAPVDGITKDFWRKVRLDFSKTNVVQTDWIKFMVIPAGTFVFDIMTRIIQVDGAQNIVIGDAAGDASNTWIAAVAVGVADVVVPTLVAETLGATRGKFYASAGALYLSPAGVDLDTLIIDIYVHCMLLDGLLT
jgi:hypothetical protein